MARIRAQIQQHAEKVQRVLTEDEDMEGQLEQRVQLQLYRGTGEKVHYKLTADERGPNHLDFPYQ